MKFGMNVVFKEIFTRILFLLAMVDVKEVKTNHVVRGAKHILSNIWEIIEDTVLWYILCKFMKLLFNDEFNSVYSFAEEPFV